MFVYLSMIDTQEEQDKFSLIYNKYKHFMWYIANQVLHDTYLAEDAVQDAFLALTKHLNKIGEVESVKTKKFLVTIVKSKSIDIIRRGSGQKTELLTDSETQDESADRLLEEYITRDNYEHLLTCIEELDQIYRVVFEYKYLHQLSDREIADILNVSSKVVNVRMFRARKKLQEMLMKEVDFTYGR